MAQPESDGEFVMPTEEQIAREVVATGGIEWWPGAVVNKVEGDYSPNGRRERPVDLSGATPKEIERFVEARLALGPGAGANALQREVHSLMSEKRALEQSIIKMVEELDAPRARDPLTGTPLTMAPGSPERVALQSKIKAAKIRLAEFDGAHSSARMKAALAKAVEEEKGRYADERIIHEARRRVAVDKEEAQIEALVQKLRPSAGVKSEYRTKR